MQNVVRSPNYRPPSRIACGCVGPRVGQVFENGFWPLLKVGEKIDKVCFPTYKVFIWAYSQHHQ